MSWSKLTLSRIDERSIGSWSQQPNRITDSEPLQPPQLGIFEERLFLEAIGQLPMRDNVRTGPLSSAPASSSLSITILPTF